MSLGFNELTYVGLYKTAASVKVTLSNEFSWNFYWNFTDVCSSGSYWQQVNIGLGNSLSLKHVTSHYLNSSPSGQNGRYFTEYIFRCIFVSEKICILIKISVIFVPKVQMSSIGLDNGLASNRRHAIIWINTDLIYWWIYAALGGDELTHWGRVTHICVSKLNIIGSDNGLSPGLRQAIIWTNAGILSIGPLGTNFSEIIIKIHTFSFKKLHLKVSSGKWRPFCLSASMC